ncbi:MAG: LysM peptidoglycan-binding domain-containing protein [bacterium]
MQFQLIASLRSIRHTARPRGGPARLWLVLLAALVLAGCGSIPFGGGPASTTESAGDSAPAELTPSPQDTVSSDSLSLLLELPTPVPASLPDSPDGLLAIADLESFYRQALSAIAAGELTRAEDLLFILQDQVQQPVPVSADSNYVTFRRSFARRTLFLGGLLAESSAFSRGVTATDSVLQVAYSTLTGPAFPDSLVPITGSSRPPLVADMLRIDNALVRKWEEYFKGSGRKHFGQWLERKTEVDSLVLAILREAGLPEELIYLAVIESGLSFYARSSVGAVGPWQFMPGTAKMFRLRYDWWVDERRDLEMSTRAAVANLQRLYDQFHDWALVLAAYNAGEGRIERAIRLAGHNDYWRLHLPEQTKNFVPKFIAVARLGENYAAEGFSVESRGDLRYDVVPVDDATDLGLIARCAGVPVEEVQSLNPALRRMASPPDSPEYPIRVPPGTGGVCAAALSRVPASERLTWRKHRVNRGETLSEIAYHYGTTAREIAELNNVQSINHIKPGDQFLIPMPARLSDKARQRAQERGHYVPPDGYQRVAYTIKTGDTLLGIALKLNVSLNHLLRVNGLKKSSVIHPGQRLYAYRP